MTTKQTETQPSIVFIDNPHAPEIFAVESIGFLNHLGNIHITFATPRSDYTAHKNQINRVVIGRLVMPVSGAQGLAAGLYDFLRKQGLDPVPRPDKSHIQ